MPGIQTGGRRLFVMHIRCSVINSVKGFVSVTDIYCCIEIMVVHVVQRVQSVAASEADWPKRIREMQYADYEDHTVGS